MATLPPNHESNIGYVELEKNGEYYSLLWTENDDDYDSSKPISLSDSPFLYGKRQYGIRKAELDRFIQEQKKPQPDANSSETETLKAKITKLEKENKQLKASLENYSKEVKGKRLRSYQILVAGMAIDKYRIPSETDATTGKIVPKFDGISNIVTALDKLKKVGTLNDDLSETTIRDILKDAFESQVTGNKIQLN